MGTCKQLHSNGQHPKGDQEQALPVPQGSVMGTILLNYFIYYTASGTEGTCSRFADNTKLRGVMGRDAIQRDLDRLEECTYMNLLKFKRGQVQGPALGQ